MALGLSATLWTGGCGAPQQVESTDFQREPVETVNQRRDAGTTFVENDVRHQTKRTTPTIAELDSMELEERPVQALPRPPDPRLAGVVVQPSTDIGRNIRAVNASIRECYNAGLQRDSSLEGRIDVELDVFPSGLIRTRVTRDALGDAKVVECVLNAIRSIRFRPGSVPERVTMHLPIFFAPGA